MLSHADATAIVDIVRLVPQVFHRLRAVGDAIHWDLGVTTPMRGVLQSLFDEGPQTVPQMAAARPVSRQHIQTVVDALAKRGLAQTKSNPAHKKSSLVVLTEAGREMFVQMRMREQRILSDVLIGVDSSELKTTRETLAKLASQLAILVDGVKETENDK
jgi:DNA-binding MarR family transcriptional regulator